MNNKTYQIDIKDNLLILRTSSFKAERGSVLHGGIYNQELRASLTSGLVVLATYFILRPKPVIIYYILALIQFIVLFILLRMLVFQEPVLEAIVDKAGGKLTLSVKEIIAKKDSYLLSDLKDIRQSYVRITPENPDGISVVEKIALQHGTVIPGFGEVKEFHTVTLEFKDRGRVLIFSSNEQSEAADVYTRLRGFINA